MLYIFVCLINLRMALVYTGSTYTVHFSNCKYVFGKLIPCHSRVSGQGIIR